MARNMLSVLVLAITTALSGSAQIGTSVERYFEQVVNSNDPSAVPSLESAYVVLKQIPDLSSDEVAETVPILMVGLANKFGNVKLHAEAAMLAIGQRPDGATLLKPAISSIAGMLEDKSDPRIPRMAGVVLSTMHPRPLPEIIPLVLTFVQRSDQNLDNRAIMSGFLMQWASDQPEALAAIENVAAQPLTPATREAFLDAIGLERGTNERLNALVAAALRDPSSRVRRRAIYHVSRMGASMLAKAATDLQRIAVDPGETDENRAAAQKALRGENEQ